MNVFSFRRRSWLTAVLLVAVAICGSHRVSAQQGDEQGGSAPAQGAQLKTIAVVAGAKYEKLMADITFLGTTMGRPEAGQMVEAVVAQYTMNKVPAALDKTKAWGVIVQSDGGAFYPVACLPIANPDDVVEVAKAHGLDVREGENGMRVLSAGPRTFYLKAQNDMVFLSTGAASLERLPENAQDILSRMVADYDLRAAVSIKNIPEMYRQFAVQAMQAGLQQGMRRQADETDEQFAERQRMGQAQIGQMTRLINEIDSIKIGWAIDAPQQRTYLDFTYQFMPDSKMARQIAANAEPQTNFAGFFQPDAAVTLAFANKSDPKLIAEDMPAIENALRTYLDQINREVDKHVSEVEAREAAKSALSDLKDALEATIKEGNIDGGATLNLSPESMTLVAGAHIADPSKVESALKKVEIAARKSSQPREVKWNAASHAGVNFHTFSVPGPPDAEAQKFLGSEIDVTVGIGPDSVFLAAGRDNVAALSKAIDASNANKGKAISPFELAVSLTPIFDTIAATIEKPRDQAKAQAVADLLKNQAAGRDHIRMTGKAIPNGLQYRFEAEEGVLRAIGVAATAHARGQAGAN